MMVAREMKGEISAREKESWHSQFPEEEREKGRHPRTDDCLSERCLAVPVEREVCLWVERAHLVYFKVPMQCPVPQLRELDSM